MSHFRHLTRETTHDRSRDALDKDKPADLPHALAHVRGRAEFGVRLCLVKDLVE
jgi:hypothetical protein